MKIGFAGKGGAGKTTLSSLIIKKLSEKFKVLALDLDSNVNLATSLGMTDIDNLVAFGTKKEEVMNYCGSTKMVEWEDRVYLPSDKDGFYDFENDFIEKYSIKKGNIKSMSLGFIDDDKRGIESMCDYYEMSKVFMNHYNTGNDDFLVADLAAGVEMISRATVMSFDLIFVITDANIKNIKVANQIIKGLELTGFKKDEFSVIANKYLDEEDLDLIKEKYSEYNFIDGLGFNSELYDLDSKKDLKLGKISSVDLIVDKIVDFILEYRFKKLKTKSEIYERIKSIDTKKEDFLK